jgi:hypothetical protein
MSTSAWLPRKIGFNDDVTASEFESVLEEIEVEDHFEQNKKRH